MKFTFLKVRSGPPLRMAIRPPSPKPFLDPFSLKKRPPFFWSYRKSMSFLASFLTALRFLAALNELDLLVSKLSVSILSLSREVLKPVILSANFLLYFLGAVMVYFLPFLFFLYELPPKSSKKSNLFVNSFQLLSDPES